MKNSVVERRADRFPNGAVVVRSRSWRPIRLLPVLCIVLGLAGQAFAISFTAGNLAVLQADNASTNNTTITILELSPTTASQSSPVNSIPINGTTMPNALRTSGSAGTVGCLSDSDDGTLLIFTGHNITSTSSNINKVVPRGVGVLDNSTMFRFQAAYQGISGNQTRGATSKNNAVYYIGDQGGIYTNSATSPNPAGNFRSMKSFGGTIYVLAASKSSSTSAVSTVSGTQRTSLPGLMNDNNAVDFYIVASGSNGSTYDVLYVLDDASATTGTVAKYSLQGGSWVVNGTNTTTLGGFGLCAATNSSGGTDLYITSGDGTVAANSVYKLTDTAGYNATINLATTVTLYTAAAGTTMKGIAFAPLAANADLAVYAAAPPSNSVGATLTYTIAVTNLGPSVAVNAVLTNQWLSGVTPDGVTTNALGNLVSGAGTSITFVVFVNSNVLGAVTNLAWAGGDTFDPNSGNNTAVTIAVIPLDFNANGIDDRWEQKYGYGPTNPMSPSADDDHDGANNYSEYLADTNPTNAASYFHITALSNAAPLSVGFAPSSTGRLYTLESRADMLAGSWTNVPGQTNMLGSVGTSWLSDTNAATASNGFYRVRVQVP